MVFKKYNKILKKEDSLKGRIQKIEIKIDLLSKVIQDIHEKLLGIRFILLNDRERNK
jgi:hypothetical protein